MKKLILLTTFILSFSAMASTDYSCFGTEPFWGLSITGNVMTSELNLENESNKSEEVVSRQTAIGVGLDYVLVVKTATASATIVTGECSDGMSDTIYTNHIVYNSQNTVLYGCCNAVK
jgi:uncharacterized membrane protein